MSDTEQKYSTCADCPFFKEPVCAKLRPCAGSLPVCVDYPANQQALDKNICGFPYIYLGLMQKSKLVAVGSVNLYTELDYVGYRRAEMCSCDWDFLIKVPVENSKVSGSYRRFCHKPKAAGKWKAEFEGGYIEFVSDGGVLSGRYNTATNGIAVQYGKAMEPWENIEAFGLFLDEKGDRPPEKLFSIRTKLTIDTNEHATFYPGSLEIPVSSLMQLST